MDEAGRAQEFSIGPHQTAAKSQP